MSEFTTKSFNHNVDITRGPELVVVGDNDIVAFIPDIITDTCDNAMTISSAGAPIYTANNSTTIVGGDRVLLWGRINAASGTFETPLRWVPYFSDGGGNPSSTKVKALRDVFSPRVAYNKQSNTISLWFWTNVNNDYVGSDYDESELFTMATGVQGINDGLGKPGVEDTDGSFAKAKKVLCYCVGRFWHYGITGGELSGVQFTGVGTGFDIIPIFDKPKIIQVPAGTQTGIVMDSFIAATVEIISELCFSGPQFVARRKLVTFFGDITGADPSAVVLFEIGDCNDSPPTGITSLASEGANANITVESLECTEAEEEQGLMALAPEAAAKAASMGISIDDIIGSITGPKGPLDDIPIDPNMRPKMVRPIDRQDMRRQTSSSCAKGAVILNWVTGIKKNKNGDKLLVSSKKMHFNNGILTRVGSLVQKGIIL